MVWENVMLFFHSEIKKGHFQNLLLGGAPTSICHFFCPCVCPSVCSCVMHHIIFDHYFWYTYVKWWYLQFVFFFFFFFHFIIIFFFKVFREVRAKYSPKWKTKIISVIHLSQEQCSIWSWFLVHLCQMIISPGVFVNFFKILIFGVASGVKAQKMVQNEKKIMSAALYFRNWSSFMVHMYV